MEKPQGPFAGSGAKQRRSPRYSFDVGLRIEWGSAWLEGRVRDISVGGMQVEVASPLWVGASFMAELALDTPLRVDCVVRRVIPGRAMGVSLVVPNEADRARFEALLISAPAQK
jgi:hypothetical protein